MSIRFSSGLHRLHINHPTDFQAAFVDFKSRPSIVFSSSLPISLTLLPFSIPKVSFAILSAQQYDHLHSYHSRTLSTQNHILSAKMSSGRGFVIPLIIIIATLFLLWFYRIIPFFSTDEEHYPSYKDCAPSHCGNSTIRYPFGKCGYAPTECLDDQTLHIVLRHSYYSVLHGRVIGNITESSYYTRTLQIAQNIGDSSVFRDSSAFGDYSVFDLSEGYMVGTILNCTHQIQHINQNLTLLDWAETESHCFFYNASEYDDYIYNLHSKYNCTLYSVVVPTHRNYNISADKNLQQLKQREFQITWSIPDPCLSCNASGGSCYHHSYADGVTIANFYYGDYCFCRHGLYRSNCSEGHHRVGHVLSVGVTAGIFLAVCALFSIVVVSCIVVRRKFCCTGTATEEQSIRAFMDPVASGTPSVEIFLNYYSSQVPTRYSYAQIMIYTNNLVEKLGKGGFGSVYKGELPTGREIAVKMLDESKQSEQQFIAEVATVGTTCHVNLVRLLGYCSQGSVKALVYEYMVNGSLEKYIHGGRHDELDWKQLYSIALGTARGIAYLHDECRNRILHFDIKPHNVLLDATFCPKVADFGLAQITDREESHISVANKGTLGYAAPEMWSRLYGVVTDRSDVYSYGMLVMEMVGARQNIDFHNKESASSKFFYPEWAFKQVEKGQFENLRKGNMSEEEQGIAKKLCLVGLWCIQFNAAGRPPMSKVVQMLEGGADISTPPYPFPVDPPMTAMQLSVSDPSSSMITTPFPLPIDPPITTMQQYASGPSSAATYSLEIEKKNP